MNRFGGLALLLLVQPLLAACSDRGDPPERTPLVVFAAASLTDVFGHVEAAYEAAHPDVDVQLTFAGSQTLRMQIEQGAGADVFVSADAAHVDGLVAAGLAYEPRRLGHNRLVIITPLDDPAGIERFADLLKAERLVIGAETVPIGRYTRRMLVAAERTLGEPFADAVRARVVSEERNVRLVRAKVELGEADAAIVYRTDVNPRVRAVPLPPGLDAPVGYVVASVADRPRPAIVAAFRRWLAGRGAEILGDHGFGE